ncbi:MAG: transcription termination/antitermination protein NusA, partial [Desulfovibrio sp.]|nr:transcription termination/antitermination protein NusA [Desulfovibrio sp.]
LRGERVDIVVWSPDIVMYARNALSPAQITRITVDEDDEVLEVVVPDDQLTLAIGRKGQNVKLASRLLGWKIDIFTESRYGELNAARKGLEQLASVAEISVDAFVAAGIETTDGLVLATDEELLAVNGMTEARIADLRTAMNMLGYNPANAQTGPDTEETEESEEAAASEPDAESLDEAASSAEQETDQEAEQGDSGSERGE